MWRPLQAACARVSYFLSWPWLELWLQSLPSGLEVWFAVLRRAGEPEAACFLVPQRIRRGPLPARMGLWLHYTGRPAWDELTLEYNRILAPDPAADTMARLLEGLPREWDELHLPLLDGGAWPGCGFTAPTGFRLLAERIVPCHFVDLEAVRGQGGDYLALLSSNQRYQIRRARKGYRELGGLEWELAQSVPRAHELLAEMIKLHQAHWQGRGRAGAYAEGYMQKFHRELVARRLEAGEIQLLRLACGERTVGILYNLVKDGWVHYYQGGMNFAEFGRLRPGIVCHALAVELNLGWGHREYDFLGGEARYKKSLSTHSRVMCWARLQRDRRRLRLEDSLLALGRRLRAKGKP